MDALALEQIRQISGVSSDFLSLAARIAGYRLKYASKWMSALLPSVEESPAAAHQRLIKQRLTKIPWHPGYSGICE